MRQRILELMGVAAVISAVSLVSVAGQAPTIPARGGTAIVALWQEPPTLAPLYGGGTASSLVRLGVIEGLAETTTEGDYVPRLATRIPTVGNGGAVVKGSKLDVAWELRPGIKWSDGQPVTSADIKFTWEIWMKDPKAADRTGFSEIESIDTPNQLTAVVHYKSVYAPYPLNFSWLMPRHLLEKEADISRTDYVRRPLGTGPFRVTELKAGDSITLERSPNYRGAPQKPYLDKVIFKIVPSREVGLAQLKAGEVHAVWNLTEAHTPEVEKEPALALQVVPGPSVERIDLNTAQNKEYTDPNSVHPVLGDIELRKALLYATPKQRIIDSLLFGKAKPGSSPVSQGWAAYREPQEGYDPARASSTLDRAGWVKGADGIRSKAGVRASLTFTTTTGDQLRARVQQVLVDAWKTIGVEVKIQNVPSTVLFGGCPTKAPSVLGTFDLAMYSAAAPIDPHALIARRYHSKGIPTAVDCSGANVSRFKNAEVDKAIEEAGATLDLEKRKVAYANAMKLLNDGYVSIWLYDRATINARRAELQGWKPNTWQNFTWNVEDWFLRTSRTGS